MDNDLNNISLNELLEMKLNKRIAILKEFLDDKTISFIIDNNYDFINKISIKSLLRSAEFYMSLDGIDYASIIKWFPIMLDYDRFNILLNYLKMQKMSDEEIVKILEKSIIKDFEMADVLYEKYSDNIYQKNYLQSVEDLKYFMNKSKVNNETFNNLLNNNIKKYDSLLRRLK